MKYVRLVLVAVILFSGSSLWAAGTLSNGVFDYSDDSGVFGIKFTFDNSAFVPTVYEMITETYSSYSYPYHYFKIPSPYRNSIVTYEILGDLQSTVALVGANSFYDFGSPSYISSNPFTMSVGRYYRFSFRVSDPSTFTGQRSVTFYFALKRDDTPEPPPQQEPSLELTYPAGQSPKVFIKGWVFGASCTYTQNGTEVDLSDQVSWGGTGTFNPNTGSRSYPEFNSVGQNTIELSVTIDGEEYKEEYQVEVVNTTNYARLTDRAKCPSDAHGPPACPHPTVGPIFSGSPNVSIDGLPAARVGDTGVHSACCGPNMYSIATGDEDVLIEGKPAARKGDRTAHCGGPGRLIEGSPGDQPNLARVSGNLKEKPHTCETLGEASPRANGGGSISGNVTDTSAAGIVGVGVTAYGETNIDCWGAITGENGDYQITGLPDDTFHIYFWGGNWHYNDGYSSSWYDGKSSMDSADTVTITGSESVTGVDAMLSAEGSISGTVKDASGVGIENATVMVVDESGEATVGFTFGDIIPPASRTLVESGEYEYGAYTITGLEDGDYQVYCAAGPLGYMSEWYSDRPSQNAADPVTVAASSQVSGIDFILSGSGGIAGTVTDTTGNGIEDVYVKAFGQSTNATGISVTDENGDYEIPGLVDDSYRVEFDGESQGYGNQWYNDKANWDTAGTVAVTAPTKTTGIDVEMSSAGGTTSIPLNVIGFITDLSGPPATGNAVGITFTAQASSGTLSYRYYRATGFQTQNYGNWLLLKDWANDNNLTWMPNADDHYIIVGYVTNDPAYSNFHQAGLSIETSGNSANPIQISSFTTNITYPQSSGTAITLSTFATGGSGQLYYRYYYRKLPDGEWTEIIGYTITNTGTWTPPEDGWYVVVVHVTDDITGNTFSTAGMTCTIGE